MKYIMMLAFALAFGIASIANNFAPLFFGQDFKECGVLIASLCISIPFSAFHNVIVSQHFIPSSKDKILAVATITGAVVNLMSNLILIPRFKAMGAVMGVVVTAVVMCAVITLAARKELPIWSYLKNSIFFFLAGGVMFLIVRAVGAIMVQSVFTILIQVSVGAVFYLGASMVYLFAIKDEFLINNFSRITMIFK